MHKPMSDSLQLAREEALLRIADLTAAYDELVAAVEGANNDDEHDPEGATIAFERQQLAALLEQAHASLAAADAAVERRRRGDYGVCADCGSDIGTERLEARPSTVLCIACARGQTGRR